MFLENINCMDQMNIPCELDDDCALDPDDDCWLPKPPNCGERATRVCSGSSTTIETIRTF